MAKQQTLTKVEDLPSMEDFEEGSSLIIDEPEEPEEPEVPEEPEEPEIPPAEPGEPEEPEPPAEPEKPKEKQDKPKGGTGEEPEEPEEPEPEEASEFYQAVTNLHGIELEVDYGDVDPLSPEGVALREQNLAEVAIASQMEFLKENYPRAYRILEHESRGGSVEDLYKQGFVDYEKIQLKEDDTEQQKKILHDWYADKGISEHKITRLLEDDEDAEGGLFKAAEDILKKRQQAQKDRETQVLDKQKQQAALQKQRDEQMRGVVSEMTSSGKIGNFQIVKADQEAFYDYALTNIKRDGQGYSLVVPITDKNIGAVLQQAYFSFKNGDLSKLVETKAKTENTRRLKLNVKPSRKKPKGEEAPKPKAPEERTLEDFTVNE